MNNSKYNYDLKKSISNIDEFWNNDFIIDDDDIYNKSNNKSFNSFKSVESDESFNSNSLSDSESLELDESESES